jgi:hypothetical protein
MCDCLCKWCAHAHSSKLNLPLLCVQGEIVDAPNTEIGYDPDEKLLPDGLPQTALPTKKQHGERARVRNRHRECTRPQQSESLAVCTPVVQLQH